MHVYTIRFNVPEELYIAYTIILFTIRQTQTDGNSIIYYHDEHGRETSLCNRIFIRYSAIRCQKALGVVREFRPYSPPSISRINLRRCHLDCILEDGRKRDAVRGDTIRSNVFATMGRGETKPQSIGKVGAEVAKMTPGQMWREKRGSRKRLGNVRGRIDDISSARMNVNRYGPGNQNSQARLRRIKTEWVLQNFLRVSKTLVTSALLPPFIDRINTHSNLNRISHISVRYFKVLTLVY